MPKHMMQQYHAEIERLIQYGGSRNESVLRNAIVPKLKADKERGIIEIDTITALSGVPSEVWDYKLGTYSAMEWILERYKKKNTKRPYDKR